MFVCAHTLHEYEVENSEEAAGEGINCAKRQRWGQAQSKKTTRQKGETENRDLGTIAEITGYRFVLSGAAVIQINVCRLVI